MGKTITINLPLPLLLPLALGRTLNGDIHRGSRLAWCRFEKVGDSQGHAEHGDLLLPFAILIREGECGEFGSFDLESHDV